MRTCIYIYMTPARKYVHMGDIYRYLTCSRMISTFYMHVHIAWPAGAGVCENTYGYMHNVKCMNIASWPI